MGLKILATITVALLLSVPATSKQKPPAACVVYFSVVENDGITAHLFMTGLNGPQASWYGKYGDRDPYAGICYAAKPSEAPSDAPLYVVQWGEHLISQPYEYTYETNEQVSGTFRGTVTDNSGSTGSFEGSSDTTVPVTHVSAGVQRFYVADGWLAARDPKKGSEKFVPVAPLHNHNLTVLTSASTSLLKDAMDQIKEREQEHLLLHVAVSAEPGLDIGEILKNARQSCPEVFITDIKSNSDFAISATADHAKGRRFSAALQGPNGSTIWETTGHSWSEMFESLCRAIDDGQIQGMSLSVPGVSARTVIGKAPTRDVIPLASTALEPVTASETENLSAVSISSNPDGAEIYIDGAFIGNAPAVFRIGIGKHSIRLSLPSYKDWAREMTILSGSEAHVAASLEKEPN